MLRVLLQDVYVAIVGTIRGVVIAWRASVEMDRLTQRLATDADTSQHTPPRPRDCSRADVDGIERGRGGA